MEKSYRIIDDGDRWTAVVCYNDRYYADYYFSKKKYQEEEVMVRLIDGKVIEREMPLIREEIWPEVKQRHEEVMAYERENGIDTALKWVD